MIRWTEPVQMPNCSGQNVFGKLISLTPPSIPNPAQVIVCPSLIARQFRSDDSLDGARADAKLFWAKCFRKTDLAHATIDPKPGAGNCLSQSDCASVQIG